MSTVYISPPIMKSLTESRGVLLNAVKCFYEVHEVSTFVFSYFNANHLFSFCIKSSDICNARILYLQICYIKIIFDFFLNVWTCGPNSIFTYLFLIRRCLFWICSNRRRFNLKPRQTSNFQDIYIDMRVLAYA